MFVRARSVPEFITSYRRKGVGEERLSTSKWGNRDKNTEIGESVCVCVCFLRVVTRLWEGLLSLQSLTQHVSPPPSVCLSVTHDLALHQASFTICWPLNTCPNTCSEPGSWKLVGRCCMLHCYSSPLISSCVGSFSLAFVEAAVVVVWYGYILRYHIAIRSQSVLFCQSAGLMSVIAHCSEWWTHVGVDESLSVKSLGILASRHGGR